MSLTPKNEKLVTELKHQLNTLIHWTEDMKKTGKGYHPEKTHLAPVVEFHKILEDAQKLFTIKLPQIDATAPPSSSPEYDSLCEQRCIEVNRQSKILLGRIDIFETLQRSMTNAEKELSQANESCRDAKSALAGDEYHNAIAQSQLCVEHSIKALFNLVNLPPPRLHEIPIDIWDLFAKSMKRKKPPRTATMEQAIKKIVGLTDYHKKSLARLSWLNSMWSSSHTIAAYGRLEISPSDLFKKEDAEIAIKYGEECHSSVRGIVNQVKYGNVKVRLSPSNID